MKRMRLLSLFFFSLIFLAGCKKENLPGAPSAGTAPPFYFVASNWVAESSLTWSETNDGTGVSLHANWTAPELTPETIINGAVLLYAKNTADGSKSSFPVTYNGGSNNLRNFYWSEAMTNSIHLSHQAYDGDNNVTPVVNDEVSFRYILLQNLPRDNDRVEVNGNLYHIEHLKHMSYDEIAAVFGIAE